MEYTVDGHAPIVRVGEMPVVVHVRKLHIDDAGKRHGYWMHLTGTSTLAPCECAGHTTAPVIDKPCPRKHDPRFRERNAKGWLICTECNRVTNRAWAKKVRAA